MLLKHYFLVMCIGLAHLNLPVGLVIAAPKNNLVTLTPPQIQAQMARFVVRIDGEGKGNGSGFIINKNGNTYTVLTNEHVIRDSTRQSLTTIDGRKHSFTTADIKILPDLDLAEITFFSTQTYEVAKLSTNPTIELGSSVYIYGWNAVNRPIYSNRKPRFASGVLGQTLSSEDSYKGYTLVFSALPAVSGLSGSPVWDENGEVIGVYGLTDRDNNSSTLGIAINTYQRYASTARGIPVSPAPTSKVSNTQPPPSSISSKLKLAYSINAGQSGIDGLAISPNGQILVSGGTDNEIKVWDVSSGKLLLILDHGNRVGSVTISPDGRTLVSGGWDNTIKVWRLQDGKLLRTLTGHQNWIPSVKISSDGQTLFSGSGDNTIKVWRLQDGKLLRTLRGHQRWVRSLEISPDEQTLFSGSGDSTIKVWRIQDGKLIRTLKGHRSWVRSLAISPDGQTLFSGGGYNEKFGRNSDNTIKVWRIQDGKLLRTLGEHSDGTIALAIVPDGQTLVSASEDSTIKVWRIQDGQTLGTFTSHKSRVTSLAISTDGQNLISGGWDDTIKLWRVIK